MLSGTYYVTANRPVRNFKRVEIEAVRPLLGGHILTTVALVKAQLLLKRLIIGIIYLFGKVRLVAEARHPHAVTEQVHPFNLEVFKIIRVLRITARKCRVRNETYHHYIGQSTNKKVVEAYRRAVGWDGHVLHHHTGVRHPHVMVRDKRAVRKFRRIGHLLSSNDQIHIFDNNLRSWIVTIARHKNKLVIVRHKFDGHIDSRLD